MDNPLKLWATPEQRHQIVTDVLSRLRTIDGVESTDVAVLGLAYAEACLDGIEDMQRMLFHAIWEKEYILDDIRPRNG